jgi:hypothetical protein
VSDPATTAAPRKWAHLTDEDFTEILEEFRHHHGYAIAVYGVAELGEGPLQNGDGDYNADAIRSWLKERREDIEDTMCEAVWRTYEWEADEINGTSDDKKEF